MEKRRSSLRILEYVKLGGYLFLPDAIFLKKFSNGIGDNLLLSLLPPHIKRNMPGKRVIIETRYPELFDHNPFVDWATDTHIRTTRRHIRPKYHIDPSTTIHLTRQMNRAIGIDEPGEPQLYLTRDEIDMAKALVPPPYLVVCPQGKQGFSANIKEWGQNNFQIVRDAFPDTTFVQIGSREVPLMQNVVDCRGLPLRTSASILHNATLFLGLEGGLMHMARAVDTRSIIIYGGFIDPAVSSYPEDIAVTGQAGCSPCFRSDRPNPVCRHMTCMRSIPPARVISTLEEFLS